MLIVGYKSGVKPAEAISALKKHLNLSHTESKRIIESVLEGNIETVKYDFVLREDLEDFRFTVK